MKGKRIIIVKDYIKERKLQDFAKDIYTLQNQMVWYRKMNDQGVLLSAISVSEKRIDEEKFLSIEMIIRTLYTKVKEYKKFLVVDPYHELVEYTDDLSQAKRFGNTTKVFLVKDTPDDAIDKIIEKIEKKEKQNKT